MVLIITLLLSGQIWQKARAGDCDRPLRRDQQGAADPGQGADDHHQEEVWHRLVAGRAAVRGEWVWSTDQVLIKGHKFKGDLNPMTLKVPIYKVEWQTALLLDFCAASLVVTWFRNWIWWRFIPFFRERGRKELWDGSPPPTSSCWLVTRPLDQRRQVRPLPLTEPVRVDSRLAQAHHKLKC